MKSFYSLFGIGLLLFTSVAHSQVEVTSQDVLSKTVKGDFEIYLSSTGDKFSVGDTLLIGAPTQPNQFATVYHKFGLDLTPAKPAFQSTEFIIEKFRSERKMVYVYGVKDSSTPKVIVVNFEASLANGETRMKGLTSEEAIERLKTAKDKLDLGLISQEEFEKLREELRPFIK